MFNVYETKIMQKYLKDGQIYNPNYDETGLQVNNHYAFFGGTGTGKTNAVAVLLQLAFQDCFKQIIIFTNDPDEKIYNMMINEIPNCNIFSYDDFIDYEDIEKDGQKLIIFDDFIAQDKKIINKIFKYAIQARKKYCTCFYLCQDFFSVPKKMRNQFAYYIFLKLTNKNDISLISRFLPFQIEKLLIQEIINNATTHKFNICIVDVKTQDKNLIFRRNLNDYYTPDDLYLYEDNPIEKKKITKQSQSEFKNSQSNHKVKKTIKKIIKKKKIKI